MAADGIYFDKAAYKPGDKITVTVILAARTKSDTFTYNTAAGNLTATTYIVADGVLTDASGKTLTLVSDDGTQAVYTTTA